jgi:hypothetical protein
MTTWSERSRAAVFVHGDFGPGELREQSLLHDSMHCTRTHGNNVCCYNRLRLRASTRQRGCHPEPERCASDATTTSKFRRHATASGASRCLPRSINTQRQQPEIDKIQFCTTGFSGQIRPLQEEWCLCDVDACWCCLQQRLHATRRCGSLWAALPD